MIGGLTFPHFARVLAPSSVFFVKLHIRFGVCGRDGLTMAKVPPPPGEKLSSLLVAAGGYFQTVASLALSTGSSGSSEEP